jgi:hypothetical protein
MKKILGLIVLYDALFIISLHESFSSVLKISRHSSGIQKFCGPNPAELAKNSTRDKISINEHSQALGRKISIHTGI